jgi:hypothetical protein
MSLVARSAIHASARGSECCPTYEQHCPLAIKQEFSDASSIAVIFMVVVFAARLVASGPE